MAQCATRIDRAAVGIFAGSAALNVAVHAGSAVTFVEGASVAVIASLCNTRTSAGETAIICRAGIVVVARRMAGHMQAAVGATAVVGAWKFVCTFQMLRKMFATVCAAIVLCAGHAVVTKGNATKRRIYCNAIVTTQQAQAKRCNKDL